MTAKESTKLAKLIEGLRQDVNNAKELKAMYPEADRTHWIYHGRVCCLEQVVNKLVTFQTGV